MVRIVETQRLATDVKRFVVEAPPVASTARPGQFVIVRLDEEGERIPLTVADFDRDRGTVTLIVQEVGRTTRQMGTLEAGASILDFVGPLGRPSHVAKVGTVVMIGGGIGIAPAYPIARAMREAGNRVVSIIGARTKDLLFWEEEMRRVSDELIVTTDDGSYGRRGLVTEPLKEMLESGSPVNLVVAIGPVPMMRAVAATTAPHKVKTIVSLNPIMVDGTGMCGGCRVSVGGDTRFACVDGPEFDGHLVDFDELVQRQRFYLDEEKIGGDSCRLRPALQQNDTPTAS